MIAMVLQTEPFEYTNIFSFFAGKGLFVCEAFWLHQTVATVTDNGHHQQSPPTATNSHRQQSPRTVRYSAAL